MDGTPRTGAAGMTLRDGLGQQSLELEVRRAATHPVAAGLCLAWVERKLESVRLLAPSSGRGEWAAGARTSLVLRLERPSGRLRGWVAHGCEARKVESIAVSRVGFGEASDKARIRVRSDRTDPFVAAFNDAFTLVEGVVIAPIAGKRSLWGALATLCPIDGPAAEMACRAVSAAAAVLSERIASAKPGASTVIEEAPRAALPFGDFCERTDLMFACSPSSGAGVSVVAYCYPRGSKGATKAACGVRRIPQPVVNTLLEALRVDDIGCRFEEDAFVCAMPQTADAVAQRVVARLQNAMKKVDGLAAKGGFAVVRGDARSISAREVIGRAVSRARSAIREV
ncbi:MAG: hypothetical protein JNJ88_11610 [Planctomycetes bacterium]|nr:hypothetical protein [Planctomycetota bacterium]